MNDTYWIAESNLSGIGGLHLALSRSVLDVSARVVRAYDWDQTACKVYETNHGSGIVEKADISTLTAPMLANHKAKIWLLSPSCQPYTVLNPNAKGELDPRAKSFLHLVQKVLPEMVVMDGNPSPEYLLVENVAGFETSSTRTVLLETLKEFGYHIAEFLLTPLQLGIPNSRLRYYLLARRTSPFHCQYLEVLRSLPGMEEPEIPEIRRYLDPEVDPRLGGQSWHPHAVPDRVLRKWGRLFDIVLPSSRRSCCFTRGYTQLVERAGSIIQMNEQLDTTSTFDVFLSRQKEEDPSAEESVELLHPLKLRYFSPSELLRLFAFEDTTTEAEEQNGKKKGFRFVWPPD
ncbi:hypothetical protein V5O48_015673, partial [Marasmius crinis-equi]